MSDFLLIKFAENEKRCTFAIAKQKDNTPP